MSQENMPEINANVPTTTEELSYHFKGYTTDKDQYKNLVSLVEAGKLKEDDIEEVKEEGKDTRYKRKSVTVKAEVPVIEIPGFTDAQNKHVRHLIVKQVESANKKNIDECTGEFAPWYEVLEAAPAARSTSVKVTTEMLEAAAESIREFATSEYNDKVGELVHSLGMKKYSVSACKGIKVAVLEKVQSILLEWYESLDAKDQATVDPVLTLWAQNIEKIINPAQEVDEDIFDL